MQHKHLQFGHGFKGVLGDEHSQAAQMTLAPGETEGGPDNWHRGADQWLFVVSGTGEAVLPRHERSSLARSVSEGMSYRSPSLTLRVSVTTFHAGVIVNGEKVPLKAGTLVLIARGETHAIRNTGKEPLRTLNVYVPPAYTEDGE